MTEMAGLPTRLLMRQETHMFNEYYAWLTVA